VIIVFMFKDILRQQQSGMDAMVGPGIIGFHMVSGPLVGFCIGYGLDYWLNTDPWGKLVFLAIGIVAGFLNVYRDSRRLVKKMDAQDASARTEFAGIDNAVENRDTQP